MCEECELLREFHRQDLEEIERLKKELDWFKRKSGKDDDTIYKLINIVNRIA